MISDALMEAILGVKRPKFNTKVRSPSYAALRRGRQRLSTMIIVSDIARGAIHKIRRLSQTFPSSIASVC